MKKQFFSKRQILILGVAALSRSVVLAQTNPPALTTGTNATVAPTATNTVSAAGATNVTQLPTTTVYGSLEAGQRQIVPSLGATVYTQSKEQIESLPAGENASFNEILLFTPGMAQDSAV